MTKIISLVLFMTGLLLVAIPRMLFPVCFYASGNIKAKMMSCYITGNITQWIGMATVFCAILIFSASSGKIKISALLFSLLLATSLFFLYLVAPGVCGAITMSCRIGTLPATLVTATIQLITATGGLALGRMSRDA